MASWSIVSQTVSFTNFSNNATSYEWQFGDGETSTAKDPVHTYADGEFYGTLISSNGCSSDTFTFTITILTGVKDIVDDPSIHIAPNPSTGKFGITWDDQAVGSADVEVFSVEGISVYQQAAISNTDIIDLSAMPEGMYVMHILKDGVRSMKQILIHK